MSVVMNLAILERWVGHSRSSILRRAIELSIRSGTTRRSGPTSVSVRPCTRASGWGVLPHNQEISSFSRGEGLS